MSHQCDTCNSTTVKWEWETPNKVTREEAERGKGYWAEDERWFVCDTCHEFIVSDRKDALIAHSIASYGKGRLLGLHPSDEALHLLEVRDDIRRVLELFWEHKTTFKELQGSESDE